MKQRTRKRHDCLLYEPYFWNWVLIERGLTLIALSLKVKFRHNDFCLMQIVFDMAWALRRVLRPVKIMI